MKSKFLSIVSTFEIISKLFNVAAKASIVLGGSLVIAYLVRIGYFPQGLSLGDGLLFLMVAIPFGLIYSLFLYSVLSSGIALYWTIQFFCGLPRKLRGKQREYLRHAELKALIFFGVCVLPLFMFLMGNKHEIFVMFMIVLSVCLFYFFTIKTIKWRESVKVGIA